MISGSPHSSATGLLTTAWEKSVGEVFSRRGQVVQLSETCLVLDLFSVEGGGEVKLWV